MMLVRTIQCACHTLNHKCCRMMVLQGVRAKRFGVSRSFGSECSQDCDKTSIKLEQRASLTVKTSQGFYKFAGVVEQGPDPHPHPHSASSGASAIQFHSCAKMVDILSWCGICLVRHTDEKCASDLWSSHRIEE